jgi:hypothetical protein
MNVKTTATLKTGPTKHLQYHNKTNRQKIWIMNS